MKDLFTIIDESEITCLQSYKRIAEKLLNEYKLQIRNKFYRIIECEFYFNSNRHNDPYVHGHERQRESCGEWYFHGSGLDITLSNDKAYGGILLRGIAKLNEANSVPTRKDAIIGPLNVCTEIFKQIGSVLVKSSFEFGLFDTLGEKGEEKMATARVFCVPRVGLNSSKNNEKVYCKRPYRFISFLNLPHKEADKIKKYLTEESKELISLEEYKEYYSGEKW